jgi:hypothetical protein
MAAVAVAVAWAAFALLQGRRTDALLARADEAHSAVAKEIEEMPDDEFMREFFKTRCHD